MALIAREPARADDGDRSKSPCVPAGQIAEWLAVLFAGQGGMVEMRAVGVARHSTDTLHAETGLYSSDEIGLSRLARDAREISPRAEGVYATLNPVMTTVGAGSATDAYIARRRWLLIDLDPDRPVGTSATDGEKAAARSVADAVVVWLRDRGWPDPIRADSGNGYHLLYRIDLPNDDGSRDLIKRFLEALAGLFNANGAKVDVTVYNASRICKLYGTLARKGEPTEERPHRVSRILHVPDGLAVVGHDRLAAVCGLSIFRPTPERPRRGIIARDLGSDPTGAYGQRALQEELDEIRSAAVGNRNNQLFKGAASIAELVLAGNLDGSALDAIELEGRRAGLTDAEVRRTMKSARDRARPRDTGHVGVNGKPPVDEGPGGIKERVDDPHRLARLFLDQHFSHPDGHTLRYWNEEWNVWRGKAWQPATEKEINALVVGCIKAEFDRVARELGSVVKGVGTRLVGNVALALRGLTLITMGSVPQQPAWLGDGPEPAECLPTQSGILHLPTHVRDGAYGEPIRPTPNFFSPNVLSYEFDPRAPRPDAWLAFLDSLWPDDTESIRCLKEWFGYLLTSDTRQQKMLLLVGPKRSGKGTITRTLKELVGEANVAAPTLSSLGGRFGCQPFIGKTVAICTESRLTGRADTQAIVERLLSISGEDIQSIERKSITNWSGTLPLRFVLMSNELPRLGDYSGALPGRMIVLKLEQSFYGREDLGLAEKIRGELPGILLWAIQGWEDLYKRGRFVQPKSGQEAMVELEELSNPMGAFIAEKCELKPDSHVGAQDIYNAWKDWCKETGRDHPGDIQGFGRNLRTAVPHLTVKRLGSDGSRTRAFVGIRLNTDWTR